MPFNEWKPNENYNGQAGRGFMPNADPRPNPNAGRMRGQFLNGSQIQEGIQDVGNFLETSLDKFTGAWQVDQTNRANAQAADLAWEREKQAIQMQNEYNTPAAQMERYEAAGLNPNLVYSQGSSGNQTSNASYNPPKYDYAPYNPAKLLSVLGTFQDMGLKQAQTNNVQAQADIIAEDTRAKQMANDLYEAGLPEKIRFAKYIPEQDWKLKDNAIWGSYFKLNKDKINYLWKRDQYDAGMAEQEYQLNVAKLKQFQEQTDLTEQMKTYNTYKNQFARMGFMSGVDPRLNTLLKTLEGLGIPVKNFLDIMK